MHPVGTIQQATYKNANIVPTNISYISQRREPSFLWLRRELEISEIVALAERGYFLVIADREMVEKLNHLTELQGKWAPLDHLRVTYK